jgi:putative beta-lysine N-acetyltransferase
MLELETDRLQDLGHLLRGTFQEESLPRNSGYKSMLMGPSDVKEITSIYKKVFLSYPFPIHDPGYILETMKENVRYYGIRKDRQLVALASAEVDMENANAEMTDFATLDGYRGKKLGQRLLARMESDMKNLGITTLYTIARLESIPMNKVFLKHQYQYGGTLVNNTNIAGKIESMNVYYKHI